MIDIASHYVTTIEIATKQSSDGTTKWTNFTGFNAKGEKELEITFFHSDGKAITLKLGEDE